MEYHDTYYLNASEALKNALQNNKVLAQNKTVSALQICYYSGQKIENTPQNCIHVPFETIVAFFSTTKYRIPKVVETSNDSLKNQFYEKLREVENILNQKKEKLYQEIKNLRPDFQDKKLRIFAYGCRETVLIKYFMQDIIEASRDLGHETYLHTQINQLEACSEVSYLEALRDFNPHVTININHFNNHFLNESIFNFVWFQDFTPQLMKHEKPFLRKRDYIFSLITGLMQFLEQKGIKNEILPFMINPNLYKPRANIKKEKKIVFIGTSYATRVKDIQDDQDYDKVYLDAVKIFEERSYLKHTEHENSEIFYLMQKHNKSQEYIENIYGYLMRDYCVEKLCSLDNTHYKIEIYGQGWENNSIITPFYKGIVEHGEEVSKIYNSATYGYCPGGYVLMQRTLECAFSETIPLVLDARADKQDIYDKRIEESIEFFHINTLEQILKKEPKTKSFDLIKKQYSYKHFINRCIEIIQKELS